MTQNAILSNRFSLDIPPDQLQAIQAHLQGLIDLLQPHLQGLQAEERRNLPKMGTKTVDFVRRAISYCRALPQFRPGFLDADEFQRDLDAIDTLDALSHPLAKLLSMLDDSMLLAGSDAFENALSFYDVVKTGAKRGDPDAQAAAADLAERFPARRAAKPVPATGPSPAPGAVPAVVPAPVSAAASPVASASGAGTVPSSAPLARPVIAS